MSRHAKVVKEAKYVLGQAAESAEPARKSSERSFVYCNIPHYSLRTKAKSKAGIQILIAFHTHNLRGDE